MFQKKQGENWIIKPGIKKHPKTDETGDVRLHLFVGHMFSVKILAVLNI